MEKSASEKLFNLYVEELVERGLIDRALASSGNYVFLGEISGDDLNAAESNAVARYNREFAWLYGRLNDEVWEGFREKCWREGL